DLNLRPSGYEPDELPGCSTPRYQRKSGQDLPLQSKLARVCVSTRLLPKAKSRLFRIFTVRQKTACFIRILQRKRAAFGGPLISAGPTVC
ncbi:hypothetical protein, partial [Rhizobium rhizophilum]|uniref:hypothetical protein n=1 Tax=Rhizobium rhizophilum TaxID=1850373 RepID=UPI00197F31AD